MSVLYWIVDNYKVLGFIALCAILGCFYGYHEYRVEELQKTALEWQERAQTAESALAVMVEEKARLTSALSEQEKATAEAQAKRKVVYRTVKEEIAKDENARSWYDSPVPSSLVRVLQGGADHD